MYAVTGITGQVGGADRDALLSMPDYPFAPSCAMRPRAPPGRSVAAKSPLPT